MRRLLLIRVSFLLAVVFFFNSNAVKAQSLEETLSNLSSSVGAAYVAPIISAFGSNLNSGWVSGVPSASLVGFSLQIKVIGVGSFFSDDDNRFNASGTFRFTLEQVNAILNNSGITSTAPNYITIRDAMLDEAWQVNFSGPTIVGSKDESVNINFPGETIEGQNIGAYDLVIDQVKGYLSELPALPQVAAQVTVGTVMGTNVSIRWFPDIEIQDLGKFSFYGFGFLHNPGVWLSNPLPIDIGVGYFYQKLKVGNIFESTASQYGLFASKTFGFGISITPYAGLTMETSKTTIRYTYVFDGPGGIPVNDIIDFELKGKNGFGFTIGANLKLAVINLFVDYKSSSTQTVTGGLWFGF